jgi:signal peptidase I
VVATVATVAAVRALAVEPLRVSSESMAPTLRAGDRVLVEKISRHLGPPGRGDLVTFASPEDAELVLKRVVGSPGDEVALRDGELYVNGRRMHEPYVDRSHLDGVYYGPVTVPAGHVLVMGDNRESSVDSRRYGPVPADRLRGRLLTRVWPLR